VQYNIFKKVPLSERTDYKTMLSTWQIAMTLHLIVNPVETRYNIIKLAYRRTSTRTAPTCPCRRLHQTNTSVV